MTATHLNYFFICHRKLWLFTQGIHMEHTSEAVAEGKLIGENSYLQRPEKYREVEIAGSKIDHYNAKDKVVHEIKKSDSMEAAHEWQVKYYIWLLEQNGVQGVTGLLEYPVIRQKKEVILSSSDREYLLEVINKIKTIINSDICPQVIHAKICKSCSYHDFCYIDE
jgi:CRISPR-associated exonuclease Cas4